MTSNVQVITEAGSGIGSVSGELMVRSDETPSSGEPDDTPSPILSSNTIDDSATIKMLVASVLALPRVRSPSRFVKWIKASVGVAPVAKSTSNQIPPTRRHSHQAREEQ